MTGAMRYFYFFIWFLAAILYVPIFKNLYRSRWEYIDYTHAYFILPVALWLVWRMRGRLKALFQRTPAQKGIGSLAFLAFGCLLFIFASRNDYLFLSTLSLIPFLIGLSGYLHGTETAKALLFPVGYLLFLVPPPLGVLDSITLPMRYGASWATEKILMLFQYPAERAGLLLFMGGHEIFVGAPCSGFRSLITLLSLGTAYAYVTKGGALKKTLLVASIIPLALVGNVARIVALCLITYYFGHEAGEGFFHYFSIPGYTS